MSETILNVVTGIESCSGCTMKPEGCVCEGTAKTDDQARQGARERYAVVKGVWIEPNAKVQTTSDGKTHVLAWLEVP